MKHTVLILACMALLPGTGMAGVRADNDDSLSALEAQGASRRFDTEVAFLDADGADELSWQLQYTSVLGKKHQLTAVVPFIDSDVGGRLSLRSGDLAIGYSYTFKQEITANPWIPSNIGSGIGISLPTGDLGDGTGSGSTIVSPRLGYVATLGKSMALLPSLQYRRSFARENGAADIKAIAGALPFFYVNPRAFWINLSPIYLRDITHNLDAPGASVIVGKLFLKNLAISLSYTWMPTFAFDNRGESDIKYQSSWIAGFHLPFSYQAK